MKRERGQALILVLILLAVGAVMIIPFLQMASTAVKSRQMYGQYINEDFAADAAIEYGMWRLKYEPGFVEGLPAGVESPPFYITLNGVEASTTIVAQVQAGELSGQPLASRAQNEVYRVTKTFIATSTYATFAADGFESASGSGGTGTWIDSWTLSGDYQFRNYGSYEGTYHLMLRGDDNQTPGDGRAQRTVDLSGSTGLGPFLNFWARVESFESSDTARVKVSTNGTNWDELNVFNYQDSDNQWHLYQYDLSSYGRPSSFYLAFETTLSSNHDYLHIDAVGFSSSEEATIIQPGVITDYTYYVTIQCLDPNGGTDLNNRDLDRIIDILPERGASSGDYLQYIPGSTSWDSAVYESFAFDGFESGSGAGGTGAWNGNWVLSGDYYFSTDGEYEGNYHLRLRGDDNQTPGDGRAQRTVNLSGSTGVGPFLYFWARMNALESGDTVAVKVSTNGVDWDVLEVFDENDDDNIYHLHQYDLNSYNRPSTLYVAFETNMNSTEDYFYVDNVEFSNYEEGVAGEWPMPPFDPTYIHNSGSGSSLHQELTWDFENAGYEDVDFAYGEIRTLSFRARAALTEGVYCNEIQTAISSYQDSDIVNGTTAKITVGNPAQTSCSGGLLTIDKTADPLILYPDEETTVTYTIDLENVDTVPVRIYQIEDWLPSTGSSVSSESFVYVDNSAYGYIIGRSSLPVMFYDNFNRPDSNTVSYWTDSDGSGSNVAIDNNSVRLTIPSETYYGNQFLVTATSGIGDMTSSSRRSALRFTALSNQTVTKIRVYLQTEQGTSPTYRYGLQGNSGGDPSGTWLGASQQGYGDLTATTTGWQTITLNQPVSLTAGTVYHIVVRYQSGTINSSNYIALRQSTPQNLTLPYNGASDPNSSTLWYSSGYWSTQGYQPLYLLETATPTYEGDPYETTTDQSVYGVNYSGENLTISGGDQPVDTIGFYVKKNSSTNPADDLYYQIRDSTDAVVRSGTLVTKTVITTAYSWHDASLSSPLTLTNGATYRVNLYSPNSNATYYYQVLRNDNTNDATYNGRNYKGTASIHCSSVNSGSSWTNSDQYDIPFRLRTTPNASITQYSISTVGYTGIVFNYTYWRGGSSGTNPQLKVEWKPHSSGTWNTLATHTLTSSTPAPQSWNLPAEANNTSIDIRFTDITVSTREARVDDVKVTSNVPINMTPVCMPDDNEDSDFFTESWHSETQYRRWELDWDFEDYPNQSDPVWNIGSLCQGYPFADYDPYLELQPGETFEIVFQATVTLSASGSYYDEVFVRINEDYYDNDWLYSWPTGEVSVPQYDLQSETLHSILRANAMLTRTGHWWRSWHWWRHR